MVPFERALASFYRPSMVTFPLSLRVSEIYVCLFIQHSPTPPSMPLHTKPEAEKTVVATTNAWTVTQTAVVHTVTVIVNQVVMVM